MMEVWNHDIDAARPHYPAVKYRNIDPVTGDWHWAFVRLPDAFPPLVEFSGAGLTGDYPDGDLKEDDLVYSDEAGTDDDGMEIYNPALHDAKGLMCPGEGCEAPVHCVSGNPDKGKIPYWKTHNNLDHGEHCNFRHHNFDPQKGALVKAGIKGLGDPRSPETMLDNLAEKYSRDRERHPEFRKQFEGMERYRLDSVTGVENFYIRAGIVRAMKSLFKSRGFYYRENEFLIRRPLPGEENRFLGALDRLQALPPGNHLSCAMQFHMARGRTEVNKNGTVAAQAIFLKQEFGNTGHDGPKHFAIPRAVPAAGVNFCLAGIFRDAGDHMVYGPVGIETMDMGDHVLHYMDIEIRDPHRQTKQVNMGDFLPCNSPCIPH